jgi:hypothetical protein
MYDYHRISPNDRSLLPYKTLLGVLLLGLISACSPHDRFLRFVKHNPYLLELYRSDSVKIQTFQTTDTLLFFSSEKDTIRTENTIIYRDSNTIRLVRYERPCTTYLSKSINIPTKEKVIKETLYKSDWVEILRWICLLLFLLGLLNLLSKWKA